MDFLSILWLSYFVPFLSYIGNEIKTQLFARLYKTIHIYSTVEQYRWVKAFVTSKAINVNQLTMNNTNMVSDNYIPNSKQNYAIPDGKYYITHNKILFTIWINNNEIWICAFAWKNFYTITEFIDVCEANYKLRFVNAISVYNISPSYTASWELNKQVFPRDLKTIILSKNTKDRIFNNLDEFFENESLYKRLGITYRKGVLFHGVPGTGKTTLIRTICSKYKLTSIYNIDLSKDNIWDIITKIQKNSLILMEDVDRYFKHVRNNKDSNEIVSWESTFNMNKMLNMLDGVTSPDECLIVMTANDKSVIPDVMLRSGRIDLVVEFSYCTREQIIEYTKLFYDCRDDIACRIAKALKKKKLTVAQLQKHFMKHIRNVESALDDIESILA